MCTYLASKHQEFLTHQYSDFLQFTNIPGLTPTTVNINDVWHTITATVLANENNTSEDCYYEGNRLFAKHGDAFLKCIYNQWVDQTQQRMTCEHVTNEEQRYFTDENLAACCLKIGLDKYMLIRPEQSTGTETYVRLLEAFVWFNHNYGTSKTSSDWLARIIEVTNQ